MNLLCGLGGSWRDSTHSDVSPAHEDVTDRSVTCKLLLATLEEGTGLLEDDGGGLGSAQ